MRHLLRVVQTQIKIGLMLCTTTTHKELTNIFLRIKIIFHVARILNDAFDEYEKISQLLRVVHTKRLNHFCKCIARPRIIISTQVCNNSKDKSTSMSSTNTDITPCMQIDSSTRTYWIIGQSIRQLKKKHTTRYVDYRSTW